MASEKIEKPKSKLTFALTGSIGSGKSLAADIIKKEGYEVISADNIGHDALDNLAIKEKLVSAFGEQIISDSGIDRQALAEQVFPDKNKVKRMNSIIHPYIINVISKKIAEFKSSSENNSGLLFFEVPLLFEAGIEDMFDLSINIAASYRIRLERIFFGKKMTKKDAEYRMKCQMSDDQKKEKADITIENNSSIKSFEKKIKALLTTIRNSEQTDPAKLVLYIKSHKDVTEGHQSG